MSKSMLTAVALAFGLATALSVNAQSAPAADQPSSDASSHAKAAPRSPIKPGDRNCIRDTGSLIPPKKDGCLPVTGRSYDKSEIDATGETRLGPALEKLDPAIAVRGNGY
ncbi:hypothetical protein [Dyella sp. 2HG41-7]|uniref:hypothetical protein n=1 Tax=Dyella sp. 2HG41-7 TaxID=2883239 RepID=UPI001F428A0F|nr:hypothetical protein [Dyella sp. 2HG41-7]